MKTPLRIPILLVMLACSTFFANAQTIVFNSLTQTFSNGVASTAAQCNDFTTWKQTLTRTDYTVLNIRSSITSYVGTCTNATIVNSIAAFLLNSSLAPATTTWTDGSNIWNIGACNGVEVSLNNSGNCACGTGTTNACFRSCIVNVNWGGVAGATCSAPSQTLTIEFGYAGAPAGPTVPPTSGFAYNMLIDTAWVNSPYIFVNTSNNSTHSYWDIIGYSPTLNGTYAAFNPPATNPRVCATRWNFCYMDTVSNNFFWKFTQTGYYKVKLKSTNYYGSDSIYKIVVCAPPTRKPVASFFSLNRSVGFTDQLNYYDLSTNGPTNWRWFLNPSYYGVNTFAGYPIANSWYATDSVQNPYLYAFDGGIFDVC
ncbi:MAG: hypothetical protein WCO28_05130, partial [Bacteroidota bacterium]